MILKCICKHDNKGNTTAADFQNLRYGSYNRVHNESSGGHRCTVCKDEKKVK